MHLLCFLYFKILNFNINIIQMFIDRIILRARLLLSCHTFIVYYVRGQHILQAPSSFCSQLSAVFFSYIFLRCFYVKFQKMFIEIRYTDKWYRLFIVHKIFLTTSIYRRQPKKVSVRSYYISSAILFKS